MGGRRPQLRRETTFPIGKVSLSQAVVRSDPQPQPSCIANFLSSHVDKNGGGDPSLPSNPSPSTNSTRPFSPAKLRPTAPFRSYLLWPPSPCAIHCACVRNSNFHEKKTVVEFDLVGYGLIIDSLEEASDVRTVLQLNERIQSFIDVGLEEVGAPRDQTVMATTGDGAILFFDAASDAHRFAQSVHEATRQHNVEHRQPLSKRVFRSGAATGDIIMQAKPGGGFDIAGTTIARAVRLEARAQPGGLLVDEATFSAFDPVQKRLYGERRDVAGKRDESFAAYLCQLNANGPAEAALLLRDTKKDRPETLAHEFGRGKRIQVLDYFKRLRSHQYFELVFLLEMPIGQRPSDALNLDDRKSQIVKWADEYSQLETLLEVLRELTEPEGNNHP